MRTSIPEIARQIFAVLASTLGFFIVFDGVLIFWQFAPITAPQQYQNVLGHRWLRDDMVEHFPRPQSRQRPAT